MKAWTAVVFSAILACTKESEPTLTTRAAQVPGLQQAVERNWQEIEHLTGARIPSTTIDIGKLPHQDVAKYDFLRERLTIAENYDDLTPPARYTTYLDELLRHELCHAVTKDVSPHLYRLGYFSGFFKHTLWFVYKTQLGFGQEITVAREDWVENYLKKEIML